MDAASTPADRRIVASARPAMRFAGGRLESALYFSHQIRLTYDGLAIVRTSRYPNELWDATSTSRGIVLYVRDLDTGDFWSPGVSASPVAAAFYDPSSLAAPFEKRRSHEQDLDIAWEFAVCDQTEVEVRRCRVINLSSRPRRLELTTYLEWVLQDAEADHSHPAFSKLFVETTWHADLRAVFARRRARDPQQRVLCGAHWIASLEGAAQSGEIGYETSRYDFLGRGGSLERPRALTTPGALLGKVGPVLDPIGCTRVTFALAAQATACVTWGTSAADSRVELLSRIAQVSSDSASVLLDGLQNERNAVSSPCNLLENALVGQSVSQSDDALPNGQFRNGDTAQRFDPAHRAARPLRAIYRRKSEPEGDHESAAGAASDEALQFDNGIGGFSANGAEYVIRLRPTKDGKGLALPPLPWTHVVANPSAGFIATETGAGYTWTANSRENRLTHWYNDPVCDPHSEAFYLRDEDDRTYWSPLPGPATAIAPHEVRYGFGYARYEHVSHDLEQRVTQYVPSHDAVKISRIRLFNRRPQERHLTAFHYAHLALSNGTANARAGVVTWYDPKRRALYSRNSQRELAHRVAFAAIVSPRTLPGAELQTTHTSDRREFLGDGGGLDAPAGVVGEEPLSGAVGTGFDPCAVLSARLGIPADEDCEYWVLIGEADDESQAHSLVDKYQTLNAVEHAFSEATRFWSELVSGIVLDTPSRPLNLMVNGWLPYQNLCCRLWGRSAYYQSGGAYGFRDQLQDCSAFVYQRPELTREQILRNAANQFVEGDVLHWWHPPMGAGLRTRFADDLLWLPLLASEYVATTGDQAIWDEQRPFLDGPPLEPGEAERFMTPQISKESGSLYEHCCRAIDRSLAVGAHGLPLMGCGDWNDGMNRIGQGGRGESVWMGFFLVATLARFAEVCRQRQDSQRADLYHFHREKLVVALNDAGWDGAWYRRAFYDDGVPVGSAQSDECQIDALAQAWAVLSRAAPRERAEQSINAVLDRLVLREQRMIKLLDPPFNCCSHDPGYIKGYLPGVRENGGQYTHGVLWFIRALGEMGRGSQAVELLEMLTPIRHADSPEMVAQYQAEPYVIAADVYGTPPHMGRAGWTWYTGSAGWMFRVAVETILGLQIENGATLVLSPSISADWPSCRFQYRPSGGSTRYDVTIENPLRQESGVASATLDGEPVVVAGGAARLPIVRDGAIHRITAVLGGVPPRTACFVRHT